MYHTLESIEENNRKYKSYRHSQLRRLKEVCTLYLLVQMTVVPCELESSKRGNKVQPVLSRAARLVCKAPKHDDVTALLLDLHWLPVEGRTEYKIAIIVYSVITCTAPRHLSWLVLMTSLTCTSFHVLSAPLLIITPFVFWRDVKKTKRLFFHWSLCLEQSPFLCVTCPNMACLQVATQGSSTLCLWILTLPTACACVCVCGHVC